MNPYNLLSDLIHRGITLTVAGDDLRFQAPTGALTPELRDAIRDYKPEIIEILRGIESSPSIAESVAESEAVFGMTSPLPWSDPRPDIEEDHALWDGLLDRCYALDGRDPNGVFGALHGLREGGLRVERSEEGGLRITAPVGDESFWPTQDAWERERAQYLLPHREMLTRLLREGLESEGGVHMGATEALYQAFRRTANFDLWDTEVCQELEAQFSRALPLASSVQVDAKAGGWRVSSSTEQGRSYRVTGSWPHGRECECTDAQKVDEKSWDAVAFWCPHQIAVWLALRIGSELQHDGHRDERG